LGALLCVIAYAVLLIFFAGFYYDIDGDRARLIWKKVKNPGYILLLIVSGLTGAYVCAVMIYRDSKKIEDLDMYFACVMIALSWILSIGFLYFGVMIWKVVAKYRLLSESRLIHARRVNFCFCLFVCLEKKKLINSIYLFYLDNLDFIGNDNLFHWKISFDFIFGYFITQKLDC